MQILCQWNLCRPITDIHKPSTGRALLQLLQQWGVLDYNEQPHDFCVRRHVFSFKNNTVCEMPGMSNHNSCRVLFIQGGSGGLSALQPWDLLCRNYRSMSVL
jgi:hypothetical protein